MIFINKVFAYLLSFIIYVYRIFISPLNPGCCRYYPSCSAYALGALKKYPVPIAVKKIIWRIVRCNGFSRGGVDEA